MHTFTAWNPESARDIINEHLLVSGAALPILQALQRTFGHISDEAIRMVAEALNLTRAEVYGVVTFYHDFRRQPPGRHVVKLCRAEACQAVGADELADHAQSVLGIHWGETSADRGVTLEPVFCLGLCACAPAAMVDDRVVGRLDRQSLDSLLEGVKR